MASKTTRGIQITFDAADPHRLAAWWSELLGYEVEDGHELVSKLLADGIIGQDDVVEIDGRMQFREAAAAGDPTGAGPRLLFQLVPEPKTAKNRVHLDVPVAQEDLEAEVARVTGTGATFVEYGQHPGHRWAVMADPEGNEFCLH